MENKRFSSKLHNELEDALVASHELAAGGGHKHRFGEIAAGLLKDEIEIRRAGWAQFEMESMFWDALESVCEIENLSRAEFVELAEGRHPGLPVGSAVRVEIAKYFARQHAI